MVIYLLWWEVKKHLKHLKVYCSITSIDLSYNPRQIKKRPTVRLIFSKPPVNNESGICVSWRCFQPVLAQPSGTRKQELKVYICSLRNSVCNPQKFKGYHLDEKVSFGGMFQLVHDFNGWFWFP